MGSMGTTLLGQNAKTSAFVCVLVLESVCLSYAAGDRKSGIINFGGVGVKVR